LENNNTTVQRLAQYEHVAVTVVEQDPDKPDGPVTGCLNRYSYSFPRGQEVVLSGPLLADMEDVVRRGRRRLIISRGRTYTPEEAHEIRLSGAMLVYPDSEALHQAAATVGEVKNHAPAPSRRTRRTRDLALAHNEVAK
jgi:hypothetical protein